MIAQTPTTTDPVRGRLLIRPRFTGAADPSCSLIPVTKTISSQARACIVRLTVHMDSGHYDSTSRCSTEDMRPFTNNKAPPHDACSIILAPHRGAAETWLVPLGVSPVPHDIHRRSRFIAQKVKVFDVICCCLSSSPYASIAMVRHVYRAVQCWVHCTIRSPENMMEVMCLVYSLFAHCTRPRFVKVV